ncbi:MAG: GIY-YIG nuclease family protein [Bacteroidota bacterium]|jgi:predicted GIY-YIG superfamily endonuclease
MLDWFVYVLRSLTREFTYIGSIDDLERRLVEHNEGLVQCTKAYRPLRIVAYIAVESESKARGLERYFKTGSGRAILKRRILGDAAMEKEQRSPVNGAIVRFLLVPDEFPLSVR